MNTAACNQASVHGEDGRSGRTRWPRWPIAVLGLSLAGHVAGQDLRTQCGVATKTHVETIESSTHSYSFAMGGKIDGAMTRDPMGYWAYDQYWEPNVAVKLENIGETSVVNPWIQRAGTPDTRNLKSIVDSLVRPEMSEKEKARRLWEYEIHNRFHATSQDDEVADVVKRVNIYGYSLCYDASKNISDLWRAAGLKVRQGFPNGHSLAEVFYEGGWHELDSDESIISLLRDNETIASEAQVVADHDLMKRTHTYGPLANDNRLSDEGGAGLLYWEGERTGEQPSLTRHTMDFTLRPNESITWAWNPANLYHAMPFSFGGDDADSWNKQWRVMAHVMDGELTYAPDLGKATTQQYLSTQGVEFRAAGEFGSGLYLTGAKGVVDVPVRSAYPVLGGRLDVTFARQDAAAEDVAISISFDQGKTWSALWTSFPSDYSRIYVDLNPYFKKTDPARYEYLLRLELRSKARTPAVMLKGLYLRSTLQMAPLAMPGVVLGENDFNYTDSTPGSRKVRITHTWSECSADVEVPSAPVAIEPADGGTVSGTRVKLQWKPGAGTTPADYEFELSEFADMRWTLSPNFHKLVSRTQDHGTPSYTLTADGLLNPSQTYYWRVRGRSQDGVWGGWSKTFSFSAVAPAVPLDARVQFDPERRTARLIWHAGKGASVPAHFKIYGSSERGFSAFDNPYQYFAGLDGILLAPANLLLETPGVAESAEIPADLWRPYFRVVAVDREGRVSGASDVAEMPHPVIATRLLPPANRMQIYEARIATSASKGHLVSADEDGKSYQYRFRSGDDLEFSMTGAPDGLLVDSSGLISGFVTDEAKSEYRITLKVKNKAAERGDSVELVLRVAGERK